MVLKDSVTQKDLYSHRGETKYMKSGSFDHFYNYVVERAAPSRLCQMRHIQGKAYTPLYPDIIARVTQSNDYTLRPPPYVVQQTLMEFYRVCNGHYGISCEIPSSMELLTVHSYHGENNSANLYGASSPSSSAPEASVSSRSAATVKGGKCSVNNEVGIKANDFTKVLDDYRITQLRRNAQHQDTYNGRRLCMYFNTREGCRRGSYCEFLHVDKNGALAQNRRVESDVSP